MAIRSHVKVICKDGNFWYSGINCTFEEATAYYLGHIFEGYAIVTDVQLIATTTF